MKKYLIGAMLLVGASSAMAATTALCDGGTGGKKTVAGGSGVVVTSPTFFRNGFDFQCSNNVFLAYEEANATLLTVGSASKKGNQYFGGSSNGGAISALGKCAADPCTATDATNGSDAAKTAASGT